MDSRCLFKVDTIARAARGCKAYGRTDRAREIALGVVQAAFGVGDRQDYQFRYWVLWLKQALAEPDGQRFVEDAQWLARPLAAVSDSASFGYCGVRSWSEHLCGDVCNQKALVGCRQLLSCQPIRSPRFASLSTWYAKVLSFTLTLSQLCWNRSYPTPQTSTWPRLNWLQTSTAEMLA